MMLEVIFMILFILVIAATINPRWFGLQLSRLKIFFGGWLILFSIAFIGGTIDNTDKPTSRIAPGQSREPAKEQSDKTKIERNLQQANTNLADNTSGNKKNSEIKNSWGISSSKQCITKVCTQQYDQFVGAPKNDEERADRKKGISECVESIRQLVLLGSEKDNCR